MIEILKEIKISTTETAEDGWINFPHSSASINEFTSGTQEDWYIKVISDYRPLEDFHQTISSAFEKGSGLYIQVITEESTKYSGKVLVTTNNILNSGDLSLTLEGSGPLNKI